MRMKSCWRFNRRDEVALREFHSECWSRGIIEFVPGFAADGPRF